MRHALAAVALVVAVGPGWAAGKPTALLNQWYTLNDRCRGGSGDDPATTDACDRRDIIDHKLASAGWCYGRPGQIEAQMEWHVCHR